MKRIIAFTVLILLSGCTSRPTEAEITRTLMAEHLNAVRAQFGDLPVPLTRREQQVSAWLDR